MEECCKNQNDCQNDVQNETGIAEQKVNQLGVGLKFDNVSKMIFLGVFLENGHASVALSIDEANDLKLNLEKVVAEATADAETQPVEAANVT